MAKPPIQYFRSEDFSDVKEKWPQILLPKLNELSRQSTFTINGNLTVSENLAAFWWNGVIGNYNKMSGIVFPWVYDPAIPVITKKSAQAINAFPFSITNKIAPIKIACVLVAQASDVTEGEKTSQPALLCGVGWEEFGNQIRISAINGMVPGRCYSVRLLLLGE